MFLSRKTKPVSAAWLLRAYTLATQKWIGNRLFQRQSGSAHRGTLKYCASPGQLLPHEVPQRSSSQSAGTRQIQQWLFFLAASWMRTGSLSIWGLLSCIKNFETKSCRTGLCRVAVSTPFTTLIPGKASFHPSTHPFFFFFYLQCADAVHSHVAKHKYEGSVFKPWRVVVDIQNKT